MKKISSTLVGSVLLLSGFTTLLPACFAPSVPSGTSGTAVGPELAQQISHNVTNGALAVVGGVAGTMSMAQLSAFFDGTIFAGTQTYSAQVISASDQAQFQQNAYNALINVFTNDLALASGWVQVVPSTAFCSSVGASGSDLLGCENLIQHISFQVQLTDQYSGTINGYFDTTQFATLTFAQDAMNVNVAISAIPTVFEGIQAAWTAAGGTVTLPTLTSSVGALTASITKMGTQTHIAAQVATAVNIAGTANASPFSIQVPSTTSANLNYDQDTSLATIAVNVGAVDVNINSVEVKVTQSVSGTIAFDDQSDEIQIQGLTVNGLNVIDSSPGGKTVVASAQPFSGTISFYNDGLALTSTSDVSANITLTDGTSSISALSGASITARGPNKSVQVGGSDLSTTNTGSFGTGDLILPAGQCFSGIPWQVVTCQ